MKGFVIVGGLLVASWVFAHYGALVALLALAAFLAVVVLGGRLLGDR